MSDIIPVTSNIDEFNLKRECIYWIANSVRLALFFCVRFFSLLLRQEQSVFQICLLSFLPFLKIQYLPPGWNGTALLIRDWNVCRDILWMCKKTGELWGVLLIKAYPPSLAFLVFMTHPHHPPFFSFSLFFALSCQVLLRFGALGALMNTFPPSPFYICAVSQQELWNRL